MDLVKIEPDTFLSATPHKFLTNLTGANGQGDLSSFIFSIYDDNGEILSSQQGQLIPLFNALYNITRDIDNLKNKEDLYVTAINNLIKKIDYLQLTIQFDQELLTDTEFEKELEKNEDKYLIKMDKNFDNTSFKTIVDIIKKLKRNFSSDEVSELFSIPIERVNYYIDSLAKNDL